MDKDQLGKLLKIDEKRADMKQIEGEMAEPNFWENQKKAAHLSQKFAGLSAFIRKFDSAEKETELGELEREALFSDELDDKNAILSIHAGAGGTEAQDWSEMLLRMYMRFAEKNDFKAELLDKSDGEEVGIKSATLRVEGINAYGNLKSEAGVHRLVRISPFDADKARHTSFSLVEVIPEFEEVGDIEIPESELRIDVFRAGGHGGQSVNTTDSAVRITHLPTKTVVSVQNERSQLQNKEKAMQILKSRIKKIRLDELRAKEVGMRGAHVSAEWGNQIRSYVLQPYQQVKDHRTEFESTDPMGVLDGDIGGFIDAYLREQKK